MNDEVRHLIVLRESGRQGQHSASFETLHEPKDAALQSRIRVTARRDFEVAVNTETLSSETSQTPVPASG